MAEVDNCVRTCRPIRLVIKIRNLRKHRVWTVWHQVGKKVYYIMTTEHVERWTCHASGERERAFMADNYPIENWTKSSVHCGSALSYSKFRHDNTGAGRLGAAVWAPPFGRTAVWAPDVWAPALMREEIGFYRHYHYFINPV